MFCSYHKLRTINKSSLTDFKIQENFFVKAREDGATGYRPQSPGWAAVLSHGAVVGRRGPDIPELPFELPQPCPTAPRPSTLDTRPSSHPSRPLRAGPSAAQVLGPGTQGQSASPGPEPRRRPACGPLEPPRPTLVKSRRHCQMRGLRWAAQLLCGTFMAFGCR